MSDDDARPGGDVPESGPGKRASRARVLAGAGAALAVLAVLAALTLTGGSDRSPGAAGQGTDEPQQGANGPTVPPPTVTTTPTVAGPTPPPVADALLLGRSNAPVTVVEFGDYQCPNCGQFAREAKPRLIREYVETGVVQLVWRDFPYYGRQSVDAAVAARAAGRQGEFWAYHDALYADQPPPRSGRLDAEHLRGIARDLGLDMERFEADRRDPKLRDAVQADFAFGQGLGVPATPTFLIAGRPFIGAQPYENFRQAIEDARADE